MPFELHHTLVSERFTPQKRTSGETAFFKVNLKGEFPVLFPGRVNRRASATFTHRVRVDSVDPEPVDGRPGSTPLHGGVHAVNKIIPLTLRIFTPDGREFTATEITRADLNKFRDRRGAPSGPWSYSLTGESEPIFVDEDSTITNAKGTVGFSVIETVPNESAPPLVASAQVTPQRQSFQFDLFRVGTFVAEIAQPTIGSPWRGQMRLVDPDGVAVARTSGRRLTFDVGLALKSRIDALLGPRGAFIEVFGENTGGHALARLRVNDIVSAETIDMHGLLEDVLSNVEQDGGADPKDFQPNVVYTLARKSEELAAGLKLEVKSLKVGTIDVAIGPGVMLGASVPAIRLTVAVSGAAKVTFAGPTTMCWAIARGRRSATLPTA